RAQTPVVLQYLNSTRERGGRSISGPCGEEERELFRSGPENRLPKVWVDQQFPKMKRLVLFLFLRHQSLGTFEHCHAAKPQFRIIDDRDFERTRLISKHTSPAVKCNQINRER